MNVITVFGAAILAVALLIILKQLKSPYALPLSVIFTLLLTKQAVGQALNKIELLDSMISNGFLGDMGNVLLKVFGVSLLAETTSDVCRDAGENSVASKIELIAKVELLIISTPMIEKILEIIKELML